MTTPTEPTAPVSPTEKPVEIPRGCVLLLFLLGVVLVIGSVLPLFGRASRTSQMTAASLQASGIFKAMMLYAQDHDGRFPTAEGNSNEAFRRLVPEYMESERSFFVANSAWHSTARNGRPDGDIGSSPDYAQCLERGENHWAYVSGLSNTSPATLPVLADGFVEGQPGSYTADPTKKGGVWNGTRAVVVFADGSAKPEPISAKNRFRVLRPDPKTGNPVDIFTREGGLPEGARVLNPE